MSIAFGDGRFVNLAKQTNRKCGALVLLPPRRFCWACFRRLNHGRTAVFIENTKEVFFATFAKSFATFAVRFL